MVVYPRWRGELVLTDKNNTFCGGLSPLARGTRQRFSCGHELGRFIPAGAGNSSRPRAGRDKIPVYPRQRGELWRYCLPQQRKYGLSPLARGTRRVLLKNNCAGRFIPASAGNSSTNPVQMSLLAVYPRQRGELHGNAAPAGAVSGLSPLARGTPDIASCDIELERFIPASAGNSHHVL